MTIKKKESSRQCGLFDWLKEAQALENQSVNPPHGSLDIETELRNAIALDLKFAVDSNGHEISRYQVAARMSELLGTEITKSQLDNWTAPSHPHHLPASYLPSFVIGTGGQRRAFETLSRRSGLFALPGPEALRAEIQRIDEEIKRKQADKHRRQAFLKEMEK